MRFVDKTSSLDVRRLFLSSLCLSFFWYSLFVFLLFFTFIYSYFFFPWFSQETIQRTLLTVAILPFSTAVWGSIYIVETTTTTFVTFSRVSVAAYTTEPDHFLCMLNITETWSCMFPPRFRNTETCDFVLWNQWEVKGGLVLVLHLFPEEDEGNFLVQSKSMKRQNQCNPVQLLTFDWKLFYGLFG